MSGFRQRKKKTSVFYWRPERSEIRSLNFRHNIVPEFLKTRNTRRETSPFVPFGDKAKKKENKQDGWRKIRRLIADVVRMIAHGTWLGARTNGRLSPVRPVEGGRRRRRRADTISHSNQCVIGTTQPRPRKSRQSV